MRYFIEIAYKGTNYHGWQSQKNQTVPTIQGVLEKALSTILRTPIEILGSGRTDTGVHAKQTFAHFDVAEALDCEKYVYKFNALLPFDISIMRMFPVDDQTHARFDATTRSYEYHLHLSRDPFLQELSYFHKEPVNVERMNEAAKLLLGRKDFQCFSKVKTDVNNYFCEIFHAQWELRDKDHLIFHITANRFLRNMVRAIVGTLLEVGRERMTPQQVLEVIDSKNRSVAGRSVPSDGLYLSKVLYPFIKENA
ncbi:tRNA pseudouridine(38-40) synthase TruA [Persicobacter psychrovividus]|uniref:tRNA pseudouridine synthase A n=1 Tax=Persicobacter psychrovividus TaxID=387638 RepID=A0ABN6L932_9BACT|nr:tRNA pseudouridine synthase A [Persicobacter psychrovividus]